MPAPTRAQLGRAIRRLRKHRRLSLEALAGDAGWHPTYLSATERGLRNPTWEKLCGLAGALGLPITAIVQAAVDEAARPTCETCGQTLPHAASE
jgi:transcriptional regulator with XRE-family HTH domain